MNVKRMRSSLSEMGIAMLRYSNVKRMRQKKSRGIM